MGGKKSPTRESQDIRSFLGVFLMRFLFHDTGGSLRCVHLPTDGSLVNGLLGTFYFHSLHKKTCGIFVFIYYSTYIGHIYDIQSMYIY